MYKENLVLNNLQWLIYHKTQPNQIIYIQIFMYKEDLALNNLQWLICHKSNPNQSKHCWKAIKLKYPPPKKTRFEASYTKLGENIFGENFIELFSLSFYWVPCLLILKLFWIIGNGPKFKSWKWLFTFHIALILSGKVWIQLFSLQLWESSRADWVLLPWLSNQSRRMKTLNSNLLNYALKLTLCHILLMRREGLVNKNINK